MEYALRGAALRPDSSRTLPARPGARHVAARRRDRRHHVGQRRPDVRERHPRLRPLGADARADGADLRHALRRGEHPRDAGFAGAGDAPAGGARRQDSVERKALRTGEGRLRPARRIGARCRAEPSAGEDLPRFRARRGAARRRAESPSESHQRRTVAGCGEVRAEHPR